jgi:hypothetical protein
VFLDGFVGGDGYAGLLSPSCFDSDLDDGVGGLVLLDHANGLHLPRQVYIVDIEVV